MTMSDADQVHVITQEAESYDFVRFTISDIHGIPRTRVIPAKHVRQFIKDGPKVCKATIFSGPTTLDYDGMTPDFHNIATKPDLDTLYELPWATCGEFKIGEFLCEPYAIDTGNVLAASPRDMARKQLDRLAQQGLTLVSGWEMEFIILDESKKPLNPKSRFATSSGFAESEKFLYALAKYSAAANINIESISEEDGAGQMEICIYPSHGILAADQVFKFKQATRKIVLQFGLFATFMCMPWYPHGNGTDFNHSIIDCNGKNIFYDPEQEDRLSEFAHQWIAGILKHAKALSAVCAPTINCFRRFHEPWAPDTVNWGVDDRFATLRVKNNGPKGTYMENRLPSGSSNPYLVLAATIAAGLDGVEKKMACPAPVSCEDTVDRLPDTLQEALQELKADDALCQALGPDFMTRYVEEKELAEVAKFKDWTPSDRSEDTMERERDLYMEHF